MKRILYAGIYIICLIISISLFGNYEKKLIILGLNNEKIYGKIIDIEHIYGPGGGSYDKFYYAFEYNGEKYNKSFNKSTGGLFGIINSFISLSMNKHYRIGKEIQILYNRDLKFSYIKDNLLLEIIKNIILIISIPFIALIIIIGLKRRFIKSVKMKKSFSGSFNKETIFYIQDNNYKIRETIIDGIFDFTKIDLKQLIDGKVICYGIKKDNNFTEISCFDNNYIFRICKNGTEEEIISNETKDIKKYFEELLNNDVRNHFA
jgi:hypothetical protein